jgi:hypothetical protein
MELSETKRQQILLQNTAQLARRFYQVHIRAPTDPKNVAISQLYSASHGVNALREDMRDFFKRKLYLEGVCGNGHFMLLAVVRPDLIFARDDAEVNKPCLLLVDSLKKEANHYWGGFKRVAENVLT